MKRARLMKQLRQIARTKGVVLTTEEGGPHTKVLFNDRRVTVVPRHSEVNEITASKIIETAENWED